MSGNRARRGAIGLAVFALLALGLMYGVVPQLPGLQDSLEHLGDGDGAWLALAFAFEILSFASYVVLTQAVFADARIGWRASYEITMAGVAATRLLATGGAGGIVLTGWALNRSGRPAERVRADLAAFLVLLYSFFMVALVIGGLGLRTGALPGPSPWGLTVLPAAFAAVVIGFALVVALAPPDLERRLVPDPGGRAARSARFLATIPATISGGVRGAFALVRTRRPGLLGAPGWWVFDIAVLWACLHAFGEAPEPAVIVVAYFVGMLGNLLPLPGGVGGVEGGMVGALIGFGVASGPAILAVLAYRAFAFWLPIIPGTIAYAQLRRRVRGWEAERAGAIT